MPTWDSNTVARLVVALPKIVASEAKKRAVDPLADEDLQDIVGDAMVGLCEQDPAAFADEDEVVRAAGKIALQAFDRLRRDRERAETDEEHGGTVRRTLGDVAGTEPRRRRPPGRGIDIQPSPDGPLASLKRLPEHRLLKVQPEPTAPDVRIAIDRLQLLFTRIKRLGVAYAHEADGLRAAYKTIWHTAAGDYWAEELTERLIAAVVLREEAEAGDGHPTQAPRVPTAGDILSATHRTLAKCPIGVPDYVSEDVVDWALAHLAPGGGGGRSNKIGEAKLTQLLVEPERLADAIERDGEIDAAEGRAPDTGELDPDAHVALTTASRVAADIRKTGKK